MEDFEFKIEEGGLWIKDKQPRFEDSIIPHKNSKYVFLFILYRESRFFEDFVKL